MQFVMNELAGLEQVATLPGFEDATPDTVAAILEEAAKFATERARSAQRDRRPRRLAAGRTTARVKTPAGFKDAYRQFCENGWNGLTKTTRVRRPGPAAARRHRGRGDVALGEPRVRPVPAADAGRDRGDRAARLADAQGHVPAEDGRRHVDRHDEPHRAAGGLRPRGRAHARRAAGRRHVQALRPEDLHHLRRARLHREHHSPRARAHAGRAGGRQGHLAVRRAEVPGQRRRLARRAQRRALRVDRAQARHPREPDRGAGVRRQGRRDRLPRRRGEPRPRVHVHHDEPRALLGRAWRAWASPSAPTSAPSPTRATACRARPVGLDKAREGDADHRAPRHPAHADDDARVHRGDARRRLRHGGGARQRARAIPMPKRARRRTRRSPTS